MSAEEYLVQTPTDGEWWFTLAEIEIRLASKQVGLTWPARKASDSKWTTIGDLFPRFAIEQKSYNPPPNALCYITRGGQRDGPFSPDQIRNMWAAGELTADTLYWFDGLADWCPARNFCQAVPEATAAASPVSNNPESFSVVMFLTVLCPIIGVVAGIAWLCNPQTRGAGGSIAAISLLLMLVYGFIFSMVFNQ